MVPSLVGTFAFIILVVLFAPLWIADKINDLLGRLDGEE